MKISGMEQKIWEFTLKYPIISCVIGQVIVFSLYYVVCYVVSHT